MPGSVPSEAGADASQTPPPRSSRRRGRVLVAAGLAGLLLLGGGASAAFLRLRGAPEQILGVIPASTDAVVVAYLDPAASQKLNLLRLQRRFPSLASSERVRDRVNEVLDAALRPTGLDHGDVDWIGSEIAVAVDIRPPDDPGVELLLDVDDAGRADTTLRRLRAEPASNPSSWRSESHGGVDVWSGVDDSGGPEAMAIVNGVAVLSNSTSMVEATVDAAQGRVARLRDDARFKDALSDLPDAKLGFAYANVAALVGGLERDPAFGAATLGPGLGALGAVDAVAVSVSAQSDGVAIDTAQRYDRSKLTPEMLAALAQPPHPNPLLAAVPADAYAVIAQEHVDATLRALVDRLENESPGAAVSIGAVGIDELVQALSGDLAIEVEAGRSATPEAAILLGSSSDEHMQSELNRLAGAVSASSGASWRTERYSGVTIHVLTGGETALPIAPAYALVGDAAVIASSEREIERIVDASNGDPNITSSPVFGSASGGAAASDAMAFVDAQRLIGAIRGTLSPEQQAWFDRSLAPDLRNVISVSFRSDDDVTGSRSRIFVRIH